MLMTSDFGVRGARTRLVGLPERNTKAACCDTRAASMRPSGTYRDEKVIFPLEPKSCYYSD